MGLECEAVVDMCYGLGRTLGHLGTGMTVGQWATWPCPNTEKFMVDFLRQMDYGPCVLGILNS